MPKAPNAVPERLAGHGIAAMLLVERMLNRLPVAERRAMARGAIEELERNRVHPRSRPAIESARRILVGLLAAHRR